MKKIAIASKNFYVLSFRCRGLIWGLLTIPIIMLIPAINAAQQPTSTLAPGEFIASKIEDIAGIWEGQIPGGVGYRQFEVDGTLKVARSLADLKKGVIFARGKVWFEGTVLYLEDPLGQGKYEVRVQKEGNTPTRLTFILIDDKVTLRAQTLTKGMTWVGASIQE